MISKNSSLVSFFRLLLRMASLRDFFGDVFFPCWLAGVIFCLRVPVFPEPAANFSVPGAASFVCFACPVHNGGFVNRPAFYNSLCEKACWKGIACPSASGCPHDNSLVVYESSRLLGKRISGCFFFFSKLASCFAKAVPKRIGFRLLWHS